MSSRSQDSEKLALLAQQLSDMAAGNVKLVTVVTELNAELSRVTNDLRDLESAHDDLERKFLENQRG